MNVVVCSVAAEGRVRPMVAVARGLLARGWRVRFLTGARFAGAVAETGAEFVPLPDDADTPARALLDMLAREPADAVLAETSFVGVAALHTLPAEVRPVHVLCGITPLRLPSVDVAPYGLGLMPLAGPAGRLRNRFLTWLATRGIPPQAHRDADLIAQFTVAGFEYPRSDAPEHLVFLGPVNRTLRHPPAPGEPPLVHVTQGTLANRSWTDLVAPALEGLDDLPVEVLVSTGGRALDTLPPLPENASAVESADYGETLPRCSVFVTNGGYGGLHAALEHGLPILVAGDTGDRKETSARVEWAGAGINLHSGQPTPTAVRQAVRQILAEPSYAAASRRLGAQIAASPGIDGLATQVEALVSRRRREPRSRSGNPDAPGH